MPFDTGFVYELQNAVFQLEKVAIGLPVLLIAASLARFLLWALLTPVAGRLAGVVSNLCMLLFAAMLFTYPDLAMAAINYSYGLASRFISGTGAGGLPGTGILDQTMREFDGAFGQLTSIFN